MNPLKGKHEYLLFIIHTYFLMFAGCDAAVCGHLPEVVNAVPNVQGVLHFPNGTFVSYSCNDGYILQNSDNAKALCIVDNDTAHWELGAFSCKQTCGDLPDIPNAKLILKGKAPPFFPGDVIEVECIKGYISGGALFKITCSVTEEGDVSWIRSFKECKARSCGVPDDIENAVRNGNVFTFPNSVRYVCNEGYTLKGTDTIYCSAIGNWIPRLPFCEDVICPLLPHPVNGRVASTSDRDRKYGSVATYICERGFQLKGDSQRVCQNNSTWSGHPPLCTGITCLDPGEIENIRVIPKQDTYNYGDIVIFACSNGNATHSKCLESGNWSSRPPVCSAVAASTESPGPKGNVCEDPGNIPHGKWTITASTPNNSVSYSCEDGYELRGTETLVCLPTGKWNLDKLPICVKPIPVTTIVGIVIGIISLICLGIAVYLCYRWREHKIRGYGKKCKALTTDATDMDETARLEKEKKPIPVTVL